MTSEFSGLARYKRLILSLLAVNAVSVGLLLTKGFSSHSWVYGFLVWNLFLAWLPLLFAYLLAVSLLGKRWLSTKNIGLTLLWLLFLPNSFYIASDLIHLSVSSKQDILFDVVMLLSFTINGLIAGMLSVYMVHSQLYKRFWANQAHVLVALAILAASFAVYLGRNLRWNTWDVFLHPAGLLFDVSDRFINPAAHPQAFSTTLVFFVLIGSIYTLVWQFAHTIRND